jgi:hypothetical protein
VVEIWCRTVECNQSLTTGCRTTITWRASLITFLGPAHDTCGIDERQAGVRTTGKIGRLFELNPGMERAASCQDDDLLTLIEHIGSLRAITVVWQACALRRHLRGMSGNVQLGPFPIDFPILPLNHVSDRLTSQRATQVQVSRPDQAPLERGDELAANLH